MPSVELSCGLLFELFALSLHDVSQKQIIVKSFYPTSNQEAKEGHAQQTGLLARLSGGCKVTERQEVQSPKFLKDSIYYCYFNVI